MTFTSDREVIQYISERTGIQFSDEQLKILEHRGGMCVLASAGSGKTTLLTNLLAKRILTGEISDTNKVLCTTYSKSGADEMNDRIKILFKKLGIKSEITVKTLHAFYLMILKHFGYNFNVIDNSQRLRFITEACRECKVKIEDETVQTIDTLLSYQINNLFSDDNLINSYVYTLDNVSKDQYTFIRMSYNKKKQEAGLIDFDDMQLYIYSLLIQQGREDIVEYCRRLYTDFYIDEAQDVSKIQFAILKRLITDPNKIVFIGDDDQCVYEWRGADPTIIQNIVGYYDIDRFILSTNYRCKNTIVDLAATGIKYNNRRCDKTMRAYNQGGKVKLVNTNGNDLYNQSKYAYKYIKELIDSGVQANKIAVLCRNNQHASILNSMLFLNGIYCDTSADMRITNTTMYSDIKAIFELAEDNNRSSVTNKILWKLVQYLGIKNGTVIASLQEHSASSLSDVLGYLINNYTTRKVEWDGKISLPAQVRGKLEYVMLGLNTTTLSYLQEVYKVLKYPKHKDRVVDLLNLYRSASDFMYKTPDKARIIDGVIRFVKDLLAELGYEDTMKTLITIEQYEQGKAVIPGYKVTMSTMHGAKGREWEYVLLFADDNVSIPSFQGIVTMQDKGVSLNDISNHIDGERRLHYVAMTRAKEELVVFTDKNNPSIFLLEAFGITKYNKDSSNISIISMANRLSIDDDIKDELKETLFGKDSKWKHNIDISDVSPCVLGV